MSVENTNSSTPESYSILDLPFYSKFKPERQQQSRHQPPEQKSQHNENLVLSENTLYTENKSSKVDSTDIVDSLVPIVQVILFLCYFIIF